MKRRWILLATIGFAVAAVDQWTKLLVVSHLTPAVARAHQRGEKRITAREKAEILEDISWTQQVAYFYGSTPHPCRAIAAHCPTVKVVDGFWNWRYVENPGAAWGLLSGASDKIRIPFFLFISVAAMAFIINFFRKLEESQQLMIISLSLVFGGAIGNFIDRLHLGYVIDFIDWYVGTSHWPTFNFADAAISSGVGLLILEWIKDTLTNRAAPAPEESSA